jgi:hypothetical protein
MIPFKVFRQYFASAAPPSHPATTAPNGLPTMAPSSPLLAPATTEQKKIMNALLRQAAYVVAATGEDHQAGVEKQKHMLAQKEQLRLKSNTQYEIEKMYAKKGSVLDAKGAGMGGLPAPHAMVEAVGAADEADGEAVSTASSEFGLLGVDGGLGDGLDDGSDMQPV